MSTKNCSNDKYWEWKPVGEKTLDATVTIRLTGEQKKKLKSLPGWQERIRSYIDDMVESVNQD